MVLPALLDSCLCVVVCWDGGNFLAVRSPTIELKLGGDAGLVSQISVHVLVSRFDYFSYCKQTKDKKRQNLENHSFTKLAFSPPCWVRLIWNLVGISGQVLGIVWYVCYVYIIVCLHFLNINKENRLYGFRHDLAAILKKTLNGHQYGYQMKGLGLGSKNMFIFLFSCLYTFLKHKKWFVCI
jgi:hypothetical protein